MTKDRDRLCHTSLPTQQACKPGPTGGPREERDPMARLLIVKPAAELLACSEAALRNWRVRCQRPAHIVTTWLPRAGWPVDLG